MAFLVQNSVFFLNVLLLLVDIHIDVDKVSLILFKKHLLNLKTEKISS